ncbi:MAG: outer membrane lipoprotein carrier protein LolA [Myxococcota bacterium]
MTNLVGKSAFEAGCGVAKRVLCVGLLGALMVASPSQAEAPEPENSALEIVVSNCRPETAKQVAARIQSRYDEIRDFEANFEQVVAAVTFAGQSLMSDEPKMGHVILAKPGKMRWTYQSPERSVVVSNGKWLWIYDVEGQSITRLEVTDGFLSGAALQFLLGDGDILESFDVVAVECSAEQVTLALHPKREATYQRLGLVADPRTGDLIATSILDLFGNRTQIRFSDARLNREPAADTFEMEIPDGVELIDYAGNAGHTGHTDGAEPANFGAEHEPLRSPAD